MSQAEKSHNVTMLRKTLDGVPDLALPAPYRFRFYRPGDEQTWHRVWTLADWEHKAVLPETFRKEFGADEALLASRQFYVHDAAGNDVGTASAWFRNGYKKKDYGLVHWVAIVPEAQGKGLAKPLMSRILLRLKELGHERAMLVTQVYRLRAIKVYLDMGFEPEIADEADAARWREVFTSPGFAPERGA